MRFLFPPTAMYMCRVECVWLKDIFNSILRNSLSMVWEHFLHKKNFNLYSNMWSQRCIYNIAKRIKHHFYWEEVNSIHKRKYYFRQKIQNLKKGTLVALLSLLFKFTLEAMRNLINYNIRNCVRMLEIVFIYFLLLSSERGATNRFNGFCKCYAKRLSSMGMELHYKVPVTEPIVLVVIHRVRRWIPYAQN